MAEDIGDPGKAQWLPQTNTIITLAFVTPISQIADYWGRKGPLVIASVVTCVGSIIVSRATNMSMAIAGNVFASTVSSVLLMLQFHDLCSLEFSRMCHSRTRNR